MLRRNRTKSNHHPEEADTRRFPVGRADLLAMAFMLAGILVFARHYLDPTARGIPVGLDIGDDLAYLGTLRSELLDSGRLLTWWSVAWDGIPLLGHPNTQFFYPPLILPTWAFGTAAGVRIAYVGSLVLAGLGMYSLARMLGPRPALAAWVGLLYAFGGGFASRIHAGHLQKVLAMPYIPLVMATALMASRANTLPGAIFWAFLTGLIHGFTFLAGEAQILVFLLVAVPIIVGVSARNGQNLSNRNRIIYGLTAWGAGGLIAVGGKLLASLAILSETIRNTDAFFGSQHLYWSIVHLTFPWSRYGVTQFGWWEYTQYIGIIPVILGGVALLIVLVLWRRGHDFLSDLICNREILAVLAVFVVGALWLADGFWYSPIRWLYEAVSPLQNNRVPSRGLMLATPAVLALAAVGGEMLLRFNNFRPLAVAGSLVVLGIGGFWLMNEPWLTPLHELYRAVPGLADAASPVRAFLLVGLTAVGVAALLFAARRLLVGRLQSLTLIAVGILVVVATADVYHVGRVIPRVAEPNSAAELRRVVDALQDRDSGPFLVELGDFGLYDNSAVRLEFADEGIPVTRRVSPLEPEHRGRHNLIGEERTIRYTVAPAPQGPDIPWRKRPKGVPGTWKPVFQEGDISVFANLEAQGDAWLVDGGQIEPLDLVSSRPGRFELRTSVSTAGSMIVVPANAFDGWKVSVDGGASRSTMDFDGYVAVEALPGEHTYELFYKAPMLPAILVLGALPWVIFLGILTFGMFYLVRRARNLQAIPN